MGIETYRNADFLALPVPAGTKSGAPLRIGGATGLNVVATTDRANTSVAPRNADGSVNGTYNYGGGNVDGQASCVLVGAHPFVVDFAVANVLDPIYITGANALSADATGNTLYGHALTTKAAPSGPLTVRIAN
ncbi:hypothetical protein [Nocardioides sp. AX2bis]|uniref:hypothetical protein n=1 Tax=Nocardioides sp. AX2bis TaxID=2653157 RepID=UPI0012F18CC9|nr:hypothetical protein [Nocardioides sp. AX2bis]VXC44390.1 conserved hypothetical protein [Nocardioides sp. AX2bis]